jgi:hypothetical protein
MVQFGLIVPDSRREIIPSYFMCKACFPHSTMFFYLWHIHRAWLKHSFKKIIDLVVHSYIFAEMGHHVPKRGWNTPNTS